MEQMSNVVIGILRRESLSVEAKTVNNPSSCGIPSRVKLCTPFTLTSPQSWTAPGTRTETGYSQRA